MSLHHIIRTELMRPPNLKKYSYGVLIAIDTTDGSEPMLPVPGMLSIQELKTYFTPTDERETNCGIKNVELALNEAELM